MKRSSLCAVLMCLMVCLLTACGQAAPEADVSQPPLRSDVSSEAEQVVPQKPQPQPEPQPQPKPKPQPEPKPQPKPKPEPEPKPQPKPKPEPKPEVSPQKDSLYVLMYHHVIPDDAPSHNDFMITVSRLREDLTWLLNHGYTPVLPSELAAGQRPDKPVLITFDDGYDSNYTLALPLLRELSIKCEIALITHHMEDGTPGFLTWDMCREMAATGLVEFGSHTHNLHTLSQDPGGPKGIQRLPDESQASYSARLSADLQTSIDLIRDNLGTPPILMAHPFGLTDSWANEFLAEHFSLTVTSKNGSARLSKGLYNLPRYNVTMEKPVSGILP